MAKSDQQAKLTFEQSLEQLEDIVHALEDGSVDLETSLAKYESGVKLLRQCYKILDSAERKIEILKSVDENGQPTMETIEDENLSLDEKSKQRSKRRSSGTKGKKKAKRKPVEDDTDPNTDVDVPGALF